MTSRAPVPAAEIGQPRRRWYGSGGSRSWSRESLQRVRDPPTARETDRRARGRVAATATAATGAPVRRRPATWSSLGPGHLRYAGAGRVPSRRRHQPVLLRPAGVPAPAAPRLPAGPGAGARWSSPPAPKSQVCPPGGRRARDHGTRARPGYPGPGQDSGERLGAPRLVAGVCSRERSDPAGARSRTAPAEPAARAGSETPQARLSVFRPPSGLGELGERQPLGSVPLASGWGAERPHSLPPPSSFAGKLACPRCSPKGPLRPAWPSLPRGPPRLHVGARWRRGAGTRAPPRSPKPAGPVLYN